MKKYYYLYKTTNLKNNYIYIGKHETYNLEDGYMGSGTKLKQAILKDGIENFRTDILIFLQSSQELTLLERMVVNNEFIKRKDVYNMIVGGEGYSKGETIITNRNYNYSCNETINDNIFRGFHSNADDIETIPLQKDIVKDTLLVVSKFYKIQTEDMSKFGRQRMYAEPRQVCMYLLKRNGVGLSNIGKLFKRDHSTVMSGIHRIENFCSSVPRIKQIVDIAQGRISKINPYAISKNELYDTDEITKEQEMLIIMQNMIKFYPQLFYKYIYQDVEILKNEHPQEYQDMLHQ